MEDKVLEEGGKVEAVATIVTEMTIPIRPSKRRLSKGNQVNQSSPI